MNAVIQTTLVRLQKTSYSPATKHYLDGLYRRHAAEASAVADLLPNCFIVGAAKSGTTTLAATLGRHRQIFGCRPKEPKFFGPEYSRGWEWYAELFKAGATKKVRIDASTMYSSADPLYLGTPQLISNYLPDAKIIYLTRHPLDRIVSHWRHWMGRRPELFGSFDELLVRDRDRRLFVECSLYDARIRGFRERFPEDSILCLTFEDMLADPHEFLKGVLAFLDVRRDARTLDSLLPDGKFRQHNPAGASGRDLVPKPAWNPDVKQQVTDLIRPDAHAFLRSAGKPESFWEGI